MRSSAPIVVQSVRSLVAGGAGGKVDVTIEREDMKTKGLWCERMHTMAIFATLQVFCSLES
jgi:hypothetical protein